MGSGGRIAAAMAGGLLAGAAKAYEVTAAQRFEERMEAIRQANRKTEREEDRSFQSEMEGERQFSTLAADTRREKNDERRDGAREEAADRRLDKQLGSQAATSAADRVASGARTQASQAQLVKKPGGELVWLSPDGTSTPAMDGDKPLVGDIVKPGAKDPDEGGLSAADQRVINEVNELYKTPAGVDRAKVVKHLATMRNARKDLAEFVAGEPVSDDGTMQSSARKTAESEAGERKSFFKSRESEFPGADGGDPDKFVARRTDEIMGGKGKEKPAEPGTAMASEAKAGPKERPAKPAQYPNAQWSEKEKAWVIQQDGKWYAVE